MASQQNAEKNKKSLARFFPNIKKTVARLFLKIMNFHLCMRVTRVHNDSGVVWLRVPHRQGRPLDDRRQEIPPGHHVNIYFEDYSTGCPDVYLMEHLYPVIENGEERNKVVLSKDDIREASQINLIRDSEGVIRPEIVKRAGFPKGFSCCFSASINEVIPPSNADHPKLANVMVT